MNTKILFGSLVMASMFLGCGMKQDPTEDLPAALKDLRPPNTKPEVPTPERSDAVRVDGPSVLSFMEEREDKVLFRAIVLDPGYNGSLEIVGLANFPGAKFNPATGEFSWRPEKGTVQEGTFKETDLEVRVYGLSKDPKVPALVSSRKVRLIISRKMSIPEVASVTSNQQSIREGSSLEAVVTVRDPDGGQAAAEAPDLLILPPALSGSVKSLASQVTVKLDSSDFAKRIWTFKVLISLDGEEFTQASDWGGFRIKAVNRFNQTSVEASYKLKVFTKLADLQTSWIDVMEVTPGYENIIPFFVYDPKSESIIDLMSVNGAPAGAEVKCSQTKIGMAACNLKWRPPYNTSEQGASLALNVRGRNQDSTDNVYTNKRLDVKLKVKYGPAPTPTPTPTPTQPPGPTPTPGPGGPTPTPVPTATPVVEEPPVTLPGPHSAQQEGVVR